jgi:hypothetical protein
MKEFDYNGDTKVMGGVLGAFLEAFGPYRKRGEQVLYKSFGVEEIGFSEKDWYHLGKFLDSMAEFQKQFGLEFMRKMGQGVFANAVFPPGIDSLEKGMAMINEAYYMNHDTSPEEIGSYKWEQQSDNKGIMVCDNPYPCAFDHGIIEVISSTFAPEAKVTHDDSKPCRHKDGDSCTYIIEW